MRTRSFTLLASLALAVGAAAITSCSSHPSGAAGGASTGGSAGAGGGANVFQADPPQVYVAKVKNILVGLPPTDDEVKQVVADPGALGGLIDGWMKLPNYAEKMKRFFQLSFQQTQLTSASFIDMIQANGIGVGPGVPLLIQNITDSFALTVNALTNVAQAPGAVEHPFNETMTTKSFMMTTALLEYYAFLDTWHVDDASKITDHFGKENPAATKIVVGTAGLSGVTLAEAADPTSPNFLHFYNPDVAGLTYTTDPSCSGIDPIEWTVTSTSQSSLTLHWLLHGGIDNHKGPTGNCGGRSTPHGDQLSPGDYGDWRMVTVRPPHAGEATTRFFDIPSLRKATELVVETPRVGFFSTPAFLANWSTNTSNQFRVTTNQALIVALGAQVDGTDMTTVPTDTSAVDSAHAQGACFSCHQLLDPTRAIMSDAWTYSYYTQEAASPIPGTRQFAFQGVVKDLSSVDDFAAVLASHPLLPSAWAQKLCYYVNSSPCAEDDPELQRIVAAFSAKMSWNTLVRELLASPITTNATPTKTTQQAEVVAVSRRDHLCAALNYRLGFKDVCGLDPATPAPPKNSPAALIVSIAGGLPSDGYGRGSTVPVLPNDPSLFFRAGLENICEAVAQIVIDDPGAPAGVKQWSSTSAAAPDDAIADFVATIMAVTPSDPRSAPSQALLKTHYQTVAAQAGATATDALRSTFTVACLAPSAAGIGM